MGVFVIKATSSTIYNYYESKITFQNELHNNLSLEKKVKKVMFY